MSFSKAGKAEKVGKNSEKAGKNSEKAGKAEKKAAKGAKVKKLICVDKWGKPDDSDGEFGGGPSQFEVEYLAHFEQLCAAQGVGTPWEACEKWPGLFKLFPEALFEKKRQDALAKRAEMRTVTRLTLIGRLKVVRFEHVDMILDFAYAPLEKWTKEMSMHGIKIAQHLKYHDCGDAECWLLSEIKADPAFATYLQKGKKEGKEVGKDVEVAQKKIKSDDDEDSPYYGCFRPYRACIHTPNEFFFRIYRQVQDDDETLLAGRKSCTSTSVSESSCKCCSRRWASRLSRRLKRSTPL